MPTVLRQRVEDKFNQMGWFKCMQDDNGAYNSIVFGDPINFETFMRFVRDGSIFFDSGMYQGNNRPYSQWRANNRFWDGIGCATTTLTRDLDYTITIINNQTATL